MMKCAVLVLVVVRNGFEVGWGCSWGAAWWCFLLGPLRQWRAPLITRVIAMRNLRGFIRAGQSFCCLSAVMWDQVLEDLGSFRGKHTISGSYERME
jgi:hypothetical protein